MTDTDLITAGESTDADKKSDSVTKDSSDLNTAAPTGALATMVLPELRALANQVGVKGTSGMRKNELIAAIQEFRDRANGTPAAAEPTPDSGEQKSSASTEAPAVNEATKDAPQQEQNASSGDTVRRERRRSSRDSGTSSRDGADSAGESPDKRGKRAAGDDADNNQKAPEKAQEDAKTDGEQRSRAVTKAPASRARVASNRAAKTMAKGGRAGEDADSATAGVVGSARVTVPTPSCVRMTSSSRSPAFLTCSTTTPLSVPPATLPARTTSTCR